MIDHNAQGWRLNTWKEVKEVIVEAMQKGNMFISEADVNNYYFSDTDRLAQAQTETAISYMEQQIFDGLRVYYSKVDPTKTEEDWKDFYYAPLIQQRIRLKMRLPLHTGSLIQVSSDIKSGNGIESEYINRIIKEGDQVDCFLNYIDEMIEMDEKAGKYLKYKLVDELTDEEIALKLGVSRRALYGIKPNAYFRIAIWSHQVAYIKENTYEFIFNYAGLYERLK